MSSRENKTRHALKPESARAVSAITRRDLIKTGAATLLGLTLSQTQPAIADTAGTHSHYTGSRRARDAAVILLFMAGGPSHIDTFDPKPHAPIGVRGPFGAIESSVEGIFLCEHLPQLARQIDKMAILRGVAHGDGSHARAQHYLLTGYLPRPMLEFPSYGSVIACEYGSRNALPPYVTLNDTPEGAGSGFPDTARQPFYPIHSGAETDEARQAFDLNQEPERLRDTYGHSDFGRSCLMARRLVERGVRCVTVTMDGWDTHSDHFPHLQNRLLPQLDRGFATLLQDLARRGLLDATLVVWMGEFGRTPQINHNAQPGRDHWPNAMSVVMAGGGIRGGQVVGGTDEWGMSPVSRGIRVEDIAATLYHAAGIDPHKEYVISGRHTRLAAGSILQELF